MQSLTGSWCVLEVIGHRWTCGLVTEETVAGAGMLRVVTPDGHEHLYAMAAVYCISRSSEDFCRKIWQARPAGSDSKPLPYTGPPGQAAPKLPPEKRSAREPAPRSAHPAAVHKVLDLPALRALCGTAARVLGFEGEDAGRQWLKQAFDVDAIHALSVVERLKIQEAAKSAIAAESIGGGDVDAGAPAP